jgi:hypothetical protein
MPEPIHDRSQENHCIFQVFDGLREGLSRFSPPSRVALIYAVEAGEPPRIYDPQGLLQGHEPKLRELYLKREIWRNGGGDPNLLRRLEVRHEPDLGLTGLISFGGRSRSMAYQMWFTEQHPDMCHTGPTERWLEHASWLLAQDMGYGEVPCIGTSGYVLREYAAHAVRDHIVDGRSEKIGWDTQIRIYPTLDAILGISETVEEGQWPRGNLVFVEPAFIGRLKFVTRFPYMERPGLKNHKHIRKLLMAVENADRFLVSDAKTIIGVAAGQMPPGSVIGDFRGGHGFLRLDEGLVCSFFDGRFHSTTRQAKLVQVEEALLETELVDGDAAALFKIIAGIVHQAQEDRFGCTLIVDLGWDPIDTAGQHLEKPLDLREPELLDLAKSLSRVDGALHIGADLHLHGFACLLDGLSVPGEDRSRGARYNSALRFTARHPDLLAVVVSADRPVSVIQGGVELTAQCEWKPVYGYMDTPPLLAEYVG